MKKTFSILAASLLMIAGCSKVQENQKGVTVTAANGDKVRLEVVSDEIIRVSAVPAGSKFAPDFSLSVVEQNNKPEFTVESTDETVTLKTAAVTATIDIASGAVSFCDKDGNVYTSEDRREFSPIEVEGSKGLTVRQVFNSPEDEGFYGLGQHQADEWNYKGLNEELYQYNTEISIPFIVSTKGYGILWDSYSFCRWGDPRDYQHLGEVFTLYDANGVEGALTGTYAPIIPKEFETLVRREEAINQEYLITPDCEKVNGAPDFHFNGSKVTFEGELLPSESGLYHFLLYYAGYTKVFIDGKEVVPEIWRTAWNPNNHKFAVNLTADKRSSLRIEWIPDGGTSYCGLRVLSPVAPEEQTKMSWWSEMQKMEDYYFIAGGDMDGVIGGYRTLTGKAQVMPKWVMGYWQSRERYRTQDEIVSTLAEFRKRHIPIDNIVQDWQYWEDDQWGSQEFDTTRFPDPKKMIDDIHAMNGRYMISVWPKFYTNTEHFKELDEKGWIYQTAVRDSVEDWLGYQQSFYDAYAPGARKLFWEQMNEHLYKYDIDSWWMDASEPNIHDCTDMDFRKALSGPTYLGTSTEYFNAYALVNAMAIYDGQRSVNPDTRVFLLTRNGFSGLQRYSTASWSGDIGTRWEDMKTQISAGLNYCLSGIPFWGQDIGGFSVENRYMAAQTLYDRAGVVSEDLKEWRELQARWHQWGVFCPLYRAHGQWPTREPWNIAPESDASFKSIVKHDQMRYILMPYIYTLAGRVHFDDYTIMRALVMDYTADKATWGISDEFMFGDAILVCPVYEYKARSREVYLPAGNGWYDLHDGFRYYEGGKSIKAAAPFEYSPLYAREGSIVPTGELIESTAEAQTDLTVYVFTGKDAQFSLYEDEGVNYNYEKGSYSNIPMTWNEAEGTLTIGERAGSFEGMPESRNISVVFVGKNGTSKAACAYNGAAVTIKK